ncbi:hypothetical protein D9M70_302390 [compost metagenome]
MLDGLGNDFGFFDVTLIDEAPASHERELDTEFIRFAVRRRVDHKVAVVERLVGEGDQALVARTVVPAQAAQLEQWHSRFEDAF